ncbi:MAG TPA: ABC transporter [Deltaproteobacteria bacterium]|jgi:lipopolysaccharide transport system permease protein|nr:ABC transporter [Deltaproteobacteria bacterium]
MLATQSPPPRSSGLAPLLDPRHHWQATREMVALLTRHRQLTWEMTKREVIDRHAGQMLGGAWALLHPLFLMGVYVFVFAFVLKARLPEAQQLPADYTTYILAGLIPWLTFQEALTRGTQAILTNASLVKQIVFPIEVLPVKIVLSLLPTLLVPIAVLALYMLVQQHALPWTLVLLPLLIVLQLLAMIGVCFILAPVGAYFRDLSELVRIFGYAGMYVVPIVYPPDWVPRLFKPFLYANPFSYLIWCWQDSLYWGHVQHPVAWIVLPTLSLLTFYAGYRVFRKLKSMLGNVL